MRGYLQIIIVTAKEYFAYRLNFVLWRVRAFLATLIMIFLWNSIFDTTHSFGNYSKERIFSYILYSSLIMTIVASSRISSLAAEIQNGGIMNMLLKPLSIFGYYASTDFVDKMMNILFGVAEFLCIIWMFSIPLIPPQQIGWSLLFLVSGICISFFINLMLSFIGFWTTDVWAPRFVFMMLVVFMSGAYFPLDLLPSPIYRLLLMTPFPYLYFLPTKIAIDGIQPDYFMQQLICSLLWAVGLFYLANYMWKKGIRDFAFWGR